ncbi:MAG: hypothetical protein IKN96_03450 [Oscillibacter sp.]|nr:hypothetical protein [Oscillibacter sp.]
MQYRTVKRAVLELIDRHSVAGEEISPAYNNQSDALRRIPGLVNQALLDIRTGPAPERSVCRLDGGERLPDGRRRHALPGDFWRLCSGGVRKLCADGARPANDYELWGERAIVTPEGSYSAEYYHYPALLPDDPTDEYECGETAEVLRLACLYAAACLMRTEDEFAYATLYEEYETRLNRLTPAVVAEVGAVADAYGFTGGDFE